jgi:hypothetical protein
MMNDHKENKNDKLLKNISCVPGNALTAYLFSSHTSSPVKQLFFFFFCGGGIVGYGPPPGPAALLMALCP